MEDTILIDCPDFGVHYTPSFAKLADKIWSEDERLDFIKWISQNPLAG